MPATVLILLRSPVTRKAKRHTTHSQRRTVAGRSQLRDVDEQGRGCVIPEDDTIRGVSAIDLASKPNTEGGTVGAAEV